MSQHKTTLYIYLLIFFSLLVFTGITIWVAFLNLGPLNTVAAISIAVFKALLVVLYFMHLRYSSRLTWVFAGAGIFWLVILITLTMTDFMSRDWLGIPPSEFISKLLCCVVFLASCKGIHGIA